MKVREMAIIGAVVAGGFLVAGAARAQEAQPAADAPAPARSDRGMSIERYDKDGNGTISLEEYKAGALAQAEERFKTMDADGDGQVTADELAKARTQFMRRGGTTGGGEARGTRQGEGRGEGRPAPAADAEKAE